jgi:hypothetical protein
MEEYRHPEWGLVFCLNILAANISQLLCPKDKVQNIYEQSKTPGSRKRGDLWPPTESPTSSSSLLCRSPLILVESVYLLCHHITKVWFCFLCSCCAFQNFVVLFPKSRWHRTPNPDCTRATTAANQSEGQQGWLQPVQQLPKIFGRVWGCDSSPFRILNGHLTSEDKGATTPMKERTMKTTFCNCQPPSQGATCTYHHPARPSGQKPIPPQIYGWIGV